MRLAMKSAMACLLAFTTVTTAAEGLFTEVIKGDYVQYAVKAGFTEDGETVKMSGTIRYTVSEKNDESITFTIDFVFKADDDEEILEESQEIVTLNLKEELGINEFLKVLLAREDDIVIKKQEIVSQKEGVKLKVAGENIECTVVTIVSEIVEDGNDTKETITVYVTEEEPILNAAKWSLVSESEGEKTTIEAMFEEAGNDEEDEVDDEDEE